MTMTFGRMKVNADEHQYRRNAEPEAKTAFSKQERNKCADKGCDGKERSGSRCTEGALRQ